MQHFHTRIALCQIILDLVGVTVLVFYTGAPESTFGFAYLLVIVGACTVLPTRWALLAAVLFMTDALRAQADRLRVSAEARTSAATQEAQAIMALAEATLRKGEAEAEAKRRLVDAENMVATKFLLRDVAVKALEVLPDVTRELMSPAKAISEIKILQLQGGPGAGSSTNDNSGAHPGFGAVSPVLKTILEAGAAYPLLREMMQFSQVDPGKLADKARAFLGTLPAEVKSVIERDPVLAQKLAELGARPGSEDAGIAVSPSAAGPESAARTRYPKCSRVSCRIMRSGASSSTRRIVLDIPTSCCTPT